MVSDYVIPVFEGNYLAHGLRGRDIPDTLMLLEKVVVDELAIGQEFNIPDAIVSLEYSCPLFQRVMETLYQVGIILF